MPRFPIEDWSAAQLRMTAFVGSSVGASSEQLWQSVVGTLPDESTSNPKKGASQSSGAFEPGKLVLRLEPDRIDLVLEPADIDLESSPVVDVFAQMGSWLQLLETFSAIAQKLLLRADQPLIVRLAFGSVLHHREATKADAYSRLGDFLPTTPTADASDFLYQINHPASSDTGIEGLRINRLTKWSVAAFRSLRLSVSPGQNLAATVAQDAAFAMRLELDINTAPDFSGPIPNDRLIDVYRELVSFGRGVAENGPLGS